MVYVHSHMDVASEHLKPKKKIYTASLKGNNHLACMFLSFSFLWVIETNFKGNLTQT